MPGTPSHSPRAAPASRTLFFTPGSSMGLRNASVESWPETTARANGGQSVVPWPDVPSQDQVGCPVAVDVGGSSVARREPEDGGRVDRQRTGRDPDVGDEGRSVAGRRDHLERAGAELDQPRRAAVERCRQVGRRLGLDGPGRLAPEEVDVDEPERRLVEGERQEVGRPARAVDERDVDERTIENRRDGRVGGTYRSIDARDQPRPEEHCGDHRPAPWAGRPGGHR